MNAKIYICKQRDYVTWFTATLFFVVAYLIVVMVDNINKTMLWGGALLISLGSTVYFYGKYKMRNELMRNGQLIWCKVDHTKSSMNEMGIVVYGNYYWKEKIFQIFVGTIQMRGYDKELYEEQLRNTCYVPVFVSKENHDRYFMALWNYQYTYNEVIANSLQKKIIRVIDFSTEGLEDTMVHK